ncbi:MAG TPA: YraN family protein [Syntrophomonas sp.]|nr:YraN family protein [Syntrophomonas sp.]
MNMPLGRQGEEIAAAYLSDKGYTILARNYRCRRGELDIVCQKGAVVVFVEVKTRRSSLFGSPEEAITRTKMQHIRTTALAYLAENKPSCRETRFDVVTIMLTGDNPQINHIKAAF